MVYQLPAARPLYFYQNDIIDGKVSQHVFMPCYSVAIKPGLLRTPLFFMVKSERDIRKFTSSYSFNRLVVLMKNNSDFPTFSNQSRCTKKFKKGEDREERGGSGQAVPPCFMFHLGLNGMQGFFGVFLGDENGGKHQEFVVIYGILVATMVFLVQTWETSPKIIAHHRTGGKQMLKTP